MLRVRNQARRRQARVLDWDQHRDRILRLYDIEDKPLREVCEIMQRDHGFHASEKMYKTRFKNWGIHKYRVDRGVKWYDQEVRRRHHQFQGARIADMKRTISHRLVAELPNDLRESAFATQLGPRTPEEDYLPPHLPCLILSPSYHDRPSPADASPYQDTVISSVNHTPGCSRETSRPSSSERASIMTPGSSRSGERRQISPLTPLGFSPPPGRNQNFLEERNDLRGFASSSSSSRRGPTCQVPRSVPPNWMLDAQADSYALAGQIVEQVVGFSSPATFSIPGPSDTFQTLMRAPLEGSMYEPAKFRQKLGERQITDPDLEIVSPQPETWTILCFQINLLLVSGQTTEARYASLRAAMIYQRLVQQRNDQLLTILNLVLTNLFLFGKHALAVELLSQAQMAASKYLDEEDPIMVSIAFMIAMARKETKSCGIGIGKLRRVVEQMRTIWGEKHRYCITADYHLAWRLAMESDLRQEALNILRQTQVRSEQVFDPLHMQTVALITTQARVLGHLGHHCEAAKAMSEAMVRIKSWDITEDYPYYLEAKRRYQVFLEEIVRVRSRSRCAPTITP